MENLPDELVQLIDRFKEHLEQYKGASYDEANTRTDFIDPLFKLLGWDVANTAGYAEQYREVIREDDARRSAVVCRHSSQKAHRGGLTCH